MGPDLHLDPDAVGRLSALARDAADQLGTAGPPDPPATLGPAAAEAVVGLVRRVQHAGAELAAFATAAETAVLRARAADRASAVVVRGEPGSTDRAVG